MRVRAVLHIRTSSGLLCSVATFGEWSTAAAETSPMGLSMAPMTMVKAPAEPECGVSSCGLSRAFFTRQQRLSRGFALAFSVTTSLAWAPSD